MTKGVIFRYCRVNQPTYFLSGLTVWVNRAAIVPFDAVLTRVHISRWCRPWGKSYTYHKTKKEANTRNLCRLKCGCVPKFVCVLLNIVLFCNRTCLSFIVHRSSFMFNLCAYICVYLFCFFRARP